MHLSLDLHLLYDWQISVSRRGTWALQLRRSIYAAVCFFPASFGVLHLNGDPDVLLWLHITLFWVWCLSRLEIMFSSSALVECPCMYPSTKNHRFNSSSMLQLGSPICRCIRSHSHCNFFVGWKTGDCGQPWCQISYKLQEDSQLGWRSAEHCSYQ